MCLKLGEFFMYVIDVIRFKVSCLYVNARPELIMGCWITESDRKSQKAIDNFTNLRKAV